MSKPLTHKQQIARVKVKLNEYEELAEELLDCGNSKDHASGQAYQSIIEDIREIIGHETE